MSREDSCIGQSCQSECEGPLSRLMHDQLNLGVLPTVPNRAKGVNARFLLVFCSFFARIFPMTLKFEHYLKIRAIP